MHVHSTVSALRHFGLRCRCAVVLLVFLSHPGFAADWSMRGGTPHRNPVVANAAGHFEWLADNFGKRGEKSATWTANLGYVSCGEPVVSNGCVWVGTNLRDPDDRHADASVLICFRERDGKELYRYISPRRSLNDYRIDWPSTSLASSPLIEGDRLWFCTNRTEVICMDISPLIKETGEPQIVWKLDMIEELGVIPRSPMIGDHSSHSSVAHYKDLIYVNTTNANSYNDVPASKAPSLICLQKKDGQVRWKDNSPGANIIDVQHANPIVFESGGMTQVAMGQGDGWLRSFNALTGDLIWKFDINPKEMKRHRYQGSAGHFVANPVFHNGKLFIIPGRERELIGGQSAVYCLETDKSGDISESLVTAIGEIRPNANSGIVWKYEGHGDKDEERMHLSLSNVAVHNGLVIAGDSNGYVHCLDEKTGQWQWTYDAFSQIVGAPLILGNKVFITNEDGDLWLLSLARELTVLGEICCKNSIEVGPIYTNGRLYITTRNQLIAIDEQ